MHKSKKIPNHLNERSTERLASLLWWAAQRAREQRHPHEHAWAQDIALAPIAIALVSGWVGQGKVAIRFVGQHDNLWHLYTYPKADTYLGTMEDPCQA